MCIPFRVYIFAVSFGVYAAKMNKFNDNFLHLILYFILILFPLFCHHWTVISMFFPLYFLIIQFKVSKCSHSQIACIRRLNKLIDKLNYVYKIRVFFSCNMGTWRMQTKARGHPCSELEKNSKNENNDKLASTAKYPW